MIRAILFDLDGTIVNTNKLVIESFKHTFKTHFNRIPNEKEITKYFGEPLRTTLERYDAEHVEALLATYRAFNEKMHDALAEEIVGAEETMKLLKNQGITIGVVTSKRKKMAERGLTLFRLLKWMDVIITPEDTVEHKPNGAPALKACEFLKVSPENTLFVGDSHLDILCGKNAGMKTCLVKYTALSLEELKQYNPDYMISNLLELLSIIQEEDKDVLIKDA